MKFTYKINNKLFYVQSIKFIDFKQLQLYILLNDDIQIMSYINNLCYNAKLNVIQKSILLLYSYLTTVNTVNKMGIEKNGLKIEKDIYIENIINNLLSVNFDNEIIKYKNLQIELGIPDDYFIFNENTANDEIINYNTYDFIKNIIIDGEDCSNILNTEKNIIVNELPGTIMEKIQQQLEMWYNKFNNTCLFDSELSYINCHLATLLTYLKKILSYNYIKLTEMEYILYRYIRISDINNITFKDAELLINEFNKDMDKQNKEMNEQEEKLNRTNMIPRKL